MTRSDKCQIRKINILIPMCCKYTIKPLIHSAPNRKTYVSQLVLQLSLGNPLKPGVKSWMKMQLEQRR